MSLTTRRTTHRLAIDAPADLIFSTLRDSSHWPYLDGLTVYSERVSGDDFNHELRTSVAASGALHSSHCHRVFDAAGRRADFRQLGLEPPLLQLGGGWEIHGTDAGSLVTLNHEFAVQPDSEALSELINANIDEYSRRELEALRHSCERGARLLQQHSQVAAATARKA
ncbi:MAG: hypothetical protein ABWX85_06285 [Arthrobacter sp.]